MREDYSHSCYIHLFNSVLKHFENCKINFLKPTVFLVTLKTLYEYHSLLYKLLYVVDCNLAVKRLNYFIYFFNFKNNILFRLDSLP